ncbi:MAG TPA: hypothetical protein IAA52_01300 [Candidatus Pullichristensenella stercorigallinarum]|uniref:Uncharacterized protein n=1 Tax=Candidatus Pullichristensenella stercorigallinarum TaxID=2840909 RepID=A0A9D0ZK44_9FIRM|nr:hypothetical protein [Candidatus Pullichristensenella stercorigallinarum]
MKNVSGFAESFDVPPFKRAVSRKKATSAVSVKNGRRKNYGNFWNTTYQAIQICADANQN